MAQLWELGALEIADAIGAGETTSREVLEALLGRIDAVNTELNAVVALVGDEAFAAADEADARIRRGGERGPFHGVPITVKENIDVAGGATTQGVTAFAGAVAATDAPVVERMRAAGAIPFARTNLPDFGLRFHTDSSLHGVTRNPWNPDVTAGGSSGGEGSALAAGMTPLGLGNDIGGSLRNPAHCNGVAAIKPTTGVVPRASAFPPEDPQLSSQLMSVEGVMARRVADVRAGLLAIAGSHRRDPLSLPVALDEPSPGTPLRIAVLADPPGGRTDPAIAATIAGVAAVLADAGHRVDEAAPASYQRAIELWAGLVSGDIAVSRPLVAPVIGADGLRFLELADAVIGSVTIEQWSLLFAERHGIARDWAAFFTDWDVVLSPTWALRAFEHGADIASAEGAFVAFETIRPVLPASLLGLPAAVVPAGLAGGLPVGAQFTAARFGDLTALAAAQEVEAAIGPITPIDPITATSLPSRRR